MLNNYHTVKKNFIRLNTSLCSSTLVECIFSSVRFINNPTRNKLSDAAFEKLIFLKEISYIQIQYTNDSEICDYYWEL